MKLVTGRKLHIDREDDEMEVFKGMFHGVTGRCVDSLIGKF